MADFCILILTYQPIDSSLLLFLAGKRNHNSTLVVVQHIPLVIAAGVVCFSHAHGVMREVDIAIVACLESAFVSVRKGPVGMFLGGGTSEKAGDEGGGNLQKSARLSV